MLKLRPTACALVLVVCSAGCARARWPDPPPVDQAKYQQEYADFRKGQLETAAYALPLVGAWSLDEGDTPFGSDPALPIALPASGIIPRAGTFRRNGNGVTVIPATGTHLRREDGSDVAGAAPADQGPPLVIGSVHLEVFQLPPDAVMVTGRDDADPLLKNLQIETYPLDPKWRVAARFDAFEKPKVVPIASTRGPAHDQTAPGQLVFQMNGQQFRLTALAEPGSDQFFLLFKDETNGKTTFSGYRMLSAKAVPNGQWTVLDFNMASNPPCAYSKFTICPLPPRENRLALAIEAGVKRHPTARGYAE
jgi:uncharacterized protein (DUF1684 family)